MAPEKKTQKLKKTRVKNIVRKKRTHFNYTEEALAQAIKAIRTENKSIREACRCYGVPRTTVQDRISGRSSSQRPRKVGPEPILGFDGEKKVVDWIIELAKCGIPVNKELLLETVAKLLKDMGKANKYPDGRPGQTWYQNFLKRHPEISLREPEGINKAREAVKERSIRNWFENLESFLIEKGLTDVMKDPERILNADETGVSLCPKSGKVLAPKGYKNVYIVKRGNEKETITVLIMMTASGKICPPLIVFPYIRPPKAVVDNMPEGWTIGKTETGWMRSDVFYEYIANDFNTWLVNNNVKKPVILFVDGHKSHMSMPLSQFCEENDIVLYALPPNTTHIMQPADVSVFRPLKQEWKRTVRNWQAKPENHNGNVTKTNFCKVFQETLDTDMTATIKNGFRKCGLYPFNADAVDYTKCVKDFQERRKMRSLSSGGLMERDYMTAQKVVLSIKDNLLKKGVDTDIVCNEIELAKSTFKNQRRSKSKTPRTSTEVIKSSTFKSPGVDNILPKLVNEVADDSCSLLENITIPDVGEYVSLSDISILKISDINFDDSNSTKIVTEENIENDKDLTSFLSQDDKISHTSNIITVAEVHNDPTVQKNTVHLKNNTFDSTGEPIFLQGNKSKNTCTVTAELNNDISTMQNLANLDVNKESEIVFDSENTSTLPQKSITLDPFIKHLKFPLDSSKPTNKKKNISKFPSAISSKAWRDYHNMKEKEKQDKINEKNKRKIEREQKKNEPAAKKKKIVKENTTQLKSANCGPIEDKEKTKNNKKVNISKNTTDDKTDRNKISDSFVLKTTKITRNKNRVYVHSNKKGIHVETKDTGKKATRIIPKEMDLHVGEQVEVNFDGEESNKATLEESFAEITVNIGEENKHEYKRKTIEKTITGNDLWIGKKANENNNTKEPRVNNREDIETVGQLYEEEQEKILLGDLEETVGKTREEIYNDNYFEEDDLTIF